MRTVLLSLLFYVSILHVNAQTILGARLIGLTNSVHAPGGFVPTDSTMFHYQGINTSNMKTGVYNYDYSIQYVYNSGTYKNYQMNTKGFFSFDSVSSYQEKMWIDSTSTWLLTKNVDNMFGINKFDSTRQILYPVTGTINFYTNFYDASNNLIKTYYLSPRISSPGIYDTLDQFTYTYNGANDLTSYMHKVWNGLVDSLINADRIDYFNNSLNEDTAELHMTWLPLPSVWQLDKIVNHIYNASKNVIQNTTQNFYATSGFTLYSKDSIAYNSNGNVASIVNSLYDTAAHIYNYNKYTTVIYDTKWHDNPTVLQTNSWTGSSWQPLDGQDNQVRYWYQEYPVMVSTVYNPANSMQLFPVPAISVLNVKIKWNEPEAFTIAIYNTQGRLLMQNSEVATTNYYRAISVSDFPAGNYILKVTANNGIMTDHFCIVK